jgi:hypothetical protein
MAALSADDKTPEETLVHWVIVGTWGLWLLGALYHVYPLLAWVLAVWGAMRRLGLTTADPTLIKPVPLGVWCWIGGMGAMVAALVVGHLNFDYTLADIAKSLFGWAKGWGLFALLPFAGASLRIRPQVLFRAMSILSAQTLAITPILILGSLIGLPIVLYTSPLSMLGGGGNTFFQVGTHWLDPGSPDVRFRFYSPWGPAAALTAQVTLVMALFDRDWRWRIVGVTSGVIVCYLAKSRLSLVAIPVLFVAIPLLSRLHRPMVVGVAGVTAFAGTFLFAVVQSVVEEGINQFRSARADSSRVRETLQRIAIHRWANEAPLFGHGMVEKGSHLVEFMPIGSHHTWNGLLFVKGAVGFAALGVPLAWTFCETLIKAQRDRVAQAALGVTLVLFINSFGENLEILGYLIWPGLLLLGIAMKRRRVGIWSSPLGGR